MYVWSEEKTKTSFMKLLNSYIYKGSYHVVVVTKFSFRYHAGKGDGHVVNEQGTLVKCMLLAGAPLICFQSLSVFRSSDSRTSILCAEMLRILVKCRMC